VIQIPREELLPKSEELRLVRGMEYNSLAILHLLLKKGVLQQALIELLEMLKAGKYDISYQSITRKRMRKSELLRELKKLIRNLTPKALDAMRFNYLLCFRFAQDYLKTQPSQELEDACTKYLVCRDTLVKHNLRIAFQAIKREPSQGSPLKPLRIPIDTASYDSDDIFMVSYEALVNASGRYDWRWNCRFYSYATWSVLAAVYRFIREQSSTMLLPQAYHRDRTKVLDTLTAAEQELGRSVDAEEVGLEDVRMPHRAGEEELEELIDQSGYDEDFRRHIALIISHKARRIFSEDELLVFESELLHDEFLGPLYGPIIGDMDAIKKRMMEQLRETRKERRRGRSGKAR